MCPSPQDLRRALGDAVAPESLCAAGPTYAIDGLSPQLAVAPNSVEALSRLMAAAWRNDAAVAPWGGGTRTELGNAITRFDLAIDLRGLDRVVAHTPADLTATVEAGLTVAELQRVLGEHGQFVALDPPLPHRATVGGTLAAGFSGPSKWQYGNPRDIVIGMRVVQADGKVTKSGGRVVKNVSGYDMSRLHIGALGTLGIIAEVSFKLTPLPHSEATLLASFDAHGPCLTAALAIFHSHVMPLALTAYNEGVRGRIVAPDLAGPNFLSIRLAGRPRTLERQVGECVALCREHRAVAVERLEPGVAGPLWRSLADFGWDDRTRPAMSGRAFLKPTKLLEVEGALMETARAGGAGPALVSHPAHGALLILWFDTQATDGPDEPRLLLERARQAVHKAGGRLVIEQAPADLKRQIDVWDEVGAALGIMRRTKETYDPKGILNPGRSVGGM